MRFGSRRVDMFYSEINSGEFTWIWPQKLKKLCFPLCCKTFFSPNLIIYGTVASVRVCVSVLVSVCLFVYV